MFGFHKKKLIPGQIYTAPASVPPPQPTASKPSDAAPTLPQRRPTPQSAATSSLDRLLNTLETLGIGALTAGLLAAFQALATPEVFLHPHKATGELVSAGIGGMVLYVRKSSWVQKALAAGQAAGTDEGK